MATTSRFHMRAFVPWLILLVLAAGCSRRTVATTGEDQASTPSSSPAAATETVKAEPLPTVTTPIEEARTAEQPVPVPPEPAASAPAQPTPELSDIFFDFDQYAIRSDARPRLKANAAILKAYPFQNVVIEGHCDERGTSAYNLVLGERRAGAASRHLQALGVPASRIQTTSYGKERPFCMEHTEVCRQSNRRAHFRVLP
jgi:peptidoglycan-associated lipoprotein